MKQTSKFKTGERYSLNDLFYSDNQIIIPDLQRDYCWGDSCHTEEKKELVSGFVKNLIEHFEKNPDRDLNLGMVYGYESPSNHIQLCDGQQRITTLFLLLGYLCKKSVSKSLRALLISDFELNHDDKEPYLKYSIRESSLYFISDLVCKVFLSEDENKKDMISDIIKKSPWYFNEYESDPSIQSMIKALDIIQILTVDKQPDWYDAFGEYISQRLTFLYYDMVNRSNGEETFVVINTTGEPLSATQNLKPLILSADINKNYDKEKSRCIYKDWEELENWFWKRRRNSNDTSDTGLNEFLRWIVIINCVVTGKKEKAKSILASGKYSFPIDGIPFEVIFKYWESLCILEKEKYIDPNWLSPGINKQTRLNIIEQSDCFLVLPLLSHCYLYSDSNSQLNRKRLYEFLKNMLRSDNLTKDINEQVPEAIKLSQYCNDIVDALNYKDISSTLLTEEEKRKIQILLEYKYSSERKDIEEFFWEAQGNNIFNGEITPLLEWAKDESVFNLVRCRSYYNYFTEVFKEPCENNIDNVRRLLITYHINNYPRIFVGNTNKSFGWEYYHWKLIIGENIGIIKDILDQCLDKKSIEEILEKRLESEDRNHWLYPFIVDKELIKYASEKNIQTPRPHLIRILRGQKANGDYLVLLCRKLLENINGWSAWRTYENDCIYANHNIYNIALDILLYNEDKAQIRVFPRKEEIGKKRNFQFEKLNLNMNSDGRYYDDIISVFDVANRAGQIMEIIKSQISQ